MCQCHLSIFDLLPLQTCWIGSDHIISDLTKDSSMSFASAHGALNNEHLFETLSQLSHPPKKLPGPRTTVATCNIAQSVVTQTCVAPTHTIAVEES